MRKLMVIILAIRSMGMYAQKIEDLPTATSTEVTDLMVVDQTDSTRHITVLNLFTTIDNLSADSIYTDTLHVDGWAKIDKVDIDDGTIDGTDVTVGAGKTLDVSAGTLTLANDQISGDKVEGGTINAIGVTTLTVTNPITEFSTDVTLGGDSDDAVPTEKAVKTYVDNIDTDSSWQSIEVDTAYTDVVVIANLATPMTTVLSPTATGKIDTTETTDLATADITVTGDWDFNLLAADSVAANYLAVSGVITGSIPISLVTAATLVISDLDSCRGMYYYNNNAVALDATLPGAAKGLYCGFYDRGGAVITVDLIDDTDIIELNGTPQAAGNSVNSPGNAGDFLWFVAIDDTHWTTQGRSGVWIDGGP